MTVRTSTQIAIEIAENMSARRVENPLARPPALTSDLVIEYERAKAREASERADERIARRNFSERRLYTSED